MECFLPLLSESNPTKRFLLVIGRLGEFTISELDGTFPSICKTTILYTFALCHHHHNHHHHHSLCSVRSDWKTVFSSCARMTPENKQQQHPNMISITRSATPNTTSETNNDSNLHYHHCQRHREFCFFNFISQIALVSLSYCRPAQLVSNNESESSSLASLSSASRTAWTFCSPLPINYGTEIRSPHVSYLFIPTPLFEGGDDTNDSALSSFHVSISEASPPLSYRALMVPFSTLR
jgi:hypothetical protein